MAGLIGEVLSIIASWNRRPVRKIRDSAIFITAFPLALLLVAGMAGGWSWRAKLWLIEFELAWTIVAVLVIAARRLPLAAEIGVAIAASSTKVDLAKVGETYLRLVASILAAEIFAGLVTLWAPVHGDLSLSFLGLFLGIGWLAYWLWTGEDVEWWKKTVKFTIALSLVAVVSGVLIPYLMPATTAELGRHSGVADEAGLSLVKSIAALFRGTATPKQAFYAVAMILIIALGVLKLLDKKKSAGGRAVAGIAVALTLVALVSWFVWGMGGVMAKGAVAPAPLGEIERREVPLAGPEAWVPVAPLPPWRVKVDQRHVRGMLDIRYNDGREVRVGSDDKLTLPGALYPTALKGEGIGLIWLCPPPSKACE